MILLLALGCSSVAPMPQGARLAPCPATPNCVSSQAPTTDLGHYIQPLAMGEGRLEALQEAVSSLPGCTLTTTSRAHLRARCVTPSGAFVDDLDVLIDGPTVHVRSSSRLGHSDLGVNRARVEALRELWRP